MVYPLELYPAFFGYYFFNSMMGVLQALHIFWAYLILRMAHKFITGKVKALSASYGPHPLPGPGSTSQALWRGSVLLEQARAGGQCLGVGRHRVTPLIPPHSR